MYRKIVYLLIAAVGVAAGCTKDPAAVTRNDAYASNNYPTSLPNLFATLVPAYGNWRSAELQGFELLCKDFAALEHATELAYGGDPSWTELTVNNLSTNNSYANDLWVGLYRGVKSTEVFFDRADFYEKNYASATEKDAISQMRGEAHFLRALYYFYLETFYGESYISGGQGGDKKGVPIITKVAPDLGTTQVKRNSVKEVWDFIIAELQLSAQQLKGVQWGGNDKGRATEWAAKALLGKAYVFTGDYASAKPILQDIINNSGKQLMPFSKYKDAFNGNSANEYNEESLFEINVDRNALGGYGIFSFPNNLTTSQGLIWSPCIIGDDGTEDNGAGLGYCNEFFNDKNLQRFGFNLPIYTTVANPDFDAGKKGSPKNLPKILDPAYRAQSLAFRSNQTVDPRLYVNAMQPWIDSGSNDGSTWRPICKFIGIGSGQRANFHGWSFKKFVTYDNTIFNRQAAADAANYYLLRLADIYLLYAETLINTGDAAQGLEYINKVKRRAYNYPVNGASPVDYTSLSDKTMAQDATLANNPLRYERWAELFNEGQWWFDVCRWKLGSSEAKYYATSLVGGAINWNDSKSYVWPVPINEINTNSNMTQSSGY
ncbi:RagB/SusD family nutrient uptake outer membrane protein [Deminuibacter soli]|uniref:RagB/SusD family nutrient uptake outer membrane protein n=1 Tax=Deminuibacter soli TaxID=2291815 RepID=A0A3E1NK68_9BACT|nr:RagB/SusD family nutrient uptake outer membrane protein [Deminuibacter soli]RFM28214.1 RagB/SusD family nutrient uptake outer membrane protein [Deminuibacter soli]